MTRSAYPALTTAQLTAVTDYATEMGRNWKAALRTDWQLARLAGPLHALRNSHGPNWLTTFTLPNDAHTPRVRTTGVPPTRGHLTQAPDPEPDHVYLEIGPNVWGKGFTREDAHAAAGKPKQYICYAITDAYAHVDGMGYICYQRDACYWEVERKGGKPRK